MVNSEKLIGTAVYLTL